jgi:hypothetical protein
LCLIDCVDRVKGRNNSQPFRLGTQATRPIRAEGQSPLFGEQENALSQSNLRSSFLCIYYSNMADNNDLRSIAADGLEALELVCKLLLS